MQNYEPTLYNLPIDTMAHYIRVMIEAARTETRISNYRLSRVTAMPPVETWEIV